ncbi:ABC transporter substrate-binding protein [Mesobaculum littorinae]|uniref:ABC transporter substrate-binding protein n=1 Tax=Mesobaculum littorinae TaxID=2486419 RepID=A0A438AG49_9RHOB|nr:ABC transporter substrate-binding protein [Mesobaculum littorinae]
MITAHAFSDLGDIKYGPDFEHLEYVNPDAPKGGELSTWARGTFDSMNPYTRQGRAHAYSTLPYESIMTSTADDAYASYCLLCETLEYPETQDWVIFNLRPEATFSDGTPLTAEDVAFTFNLFVEQGLPSFRVSVGRLIPRVEVLDEHRVKFHFNPDAPRKGLIGQAGAMVVMSKAWFEETGARLDESRLTQPPGSGPYMIDDVQVNRRITVRRNPDYWGEDLPINVGRNNFDTMRVEFFADTNAAFEAFKAGEYTFRQETSSLTWATQYGFPGIQNGSIVKEELADGSLPAATGFVFNLRKEKFQDPRVRRALGLMYNFTWTNDTLQYGLFAQRDSFWQNSDLAAQGVPEGRELELLEKVADKIDPEILTEPAVMPHESGDRQLDRRNLREASRLLDEAGWETGQDGLRRKDGQVLSVELLESNPSFDRIFVPFVDNLKRLGVDARYSRIDDAQYTARERDGDFDMIYDYYRNGLEEGLGTGQRFGCEDHLDSVFNPASYCSEAVDFLIERTIDAETLDEMQAAVRAIDRILRHSYIMIPTYYNDAYWVAYYDMYGHPDPLPPYALGVEDFWWYEADKAEALKASGAL